MSTFGKACDEAIKTAEEHARKVNEEWTDTPFFMFALSTIQGSTLALAAIGRRCWSLLGFICFTSFVNMIVLTLILARVW